MIDTHLAQIAAFIKEHNPYFDTVFPSVERSDVLGIVHDGNQIIFPMDTFGDYCYIRIPSKFNVTYSDATNNAGRSVGVSVPLVVVAIMSDADPYHLMLNLMSTIGRMCDYEKKFTSFTIHSEDVIVQELSECEQPVIDKALQNFAQGMAAVSISFVLTYTQPFTQLNCITKPCKSCS